MVESQAPALFHPGLAKQRTCEQKKSAKQTWRIQTKSQQKKLPYPLCITWTTHIFGESTLANHILQELAHAMSQKQMTILQEVHKTSPWHQAPNFPWAQWKESNNEVWGADNYPPNHDAYRSTLAASTLFDIICRNFEILIFFFKEQEWKIIMNLLKYIYIYVFDMSSSKLINNLTNMCWSCPCITVNVSLQYTILLSPHFKETDPIHSNPG
jgi:hypothetical protein